MLKLVEKEPSGEESMAEDDPVIPSQGGMNGFNMKELAQELAPLVASAMQGIDKARERANRGSRSTKKKSNDENDKDRLTFLVRKICFENAIQFNVFPSIGLESCLSTT